jgi:adenosylcobyric acid synthase
MLGRVLRDPDGIEGPPGEAAGLGLLDLETTLSGKKRLERARGVTFDGVPFEGYEMHLGRTEGPDCDHAFAVFDNGSREGAVSSNGQVFGTYVHGLFADDRQRAAWLARFAAGPTQIRYDNQIDDILDEFAAHLEAHADIDRLLTLSR